MLEPFPQKVLKADDHNLVSYRGVKYAFFKNINIAYNQYNNNLKKTWFLKFSLTTESQTDVYHTLIGLVPKLIDIHSQIWLETDVTTINSRTIST